MNSLEYMDYPRVLQYVMHVLHTVGSAALYAILHSIFTLSLRRADRQRSRALHDASLRLQR